MKIAILLSATVLSPLFAEEPISAEQTAFFEKNVRPVLVNKCYDCHSANAEKVKGGLLLDTRDGIRRGGDNGHAVVPGNLNDSLLIAAIRYTDKDTQMPPQKSGGKLSDEVIANFEQWIRMGAPDPRDGSAKTVAEMDKEKARQFWSFQPPSKKPAPTVADTAWPRSEIDRFALAAMDASGLRPVADCEPRALLRRVFFALIGMPPSIPDVNAFLAECTKGGEAQQQALAATVDKLLESRHYGERWGRHWLDVARYAESTGRESNNLYPTAWRYRDYIIESFNADKPYDQLVREQIAGDQLKAANPVERNANLVATAFLAIGTKNLPEKNKLQFTMDVVDEQIDTVSRSVLGLTVACARCHDHKFDPVTTRDYYALAGIFRSTETLYGTQGRKGRNASKLLVLSSGSPSGSDQTMAIEKPLAVGNEGNAGMGKKKNAGGKKGKGGGPTQSPQQILHEIMGVRDGAIADCPVYLRGEVDDQGAKVPRGFVQVISGGRVAQLSGSSSGRLELAQWLSSPENPLTARVMVNRIWQHLFGQGIVRTADNFGATGERPTHPELLDFLALRFMDNGWSVKKMIREIVLSRVYQLSTRSDGANNQIDPGNRLLWRGNPRRLDAE
ncbi:MAG: DUF1549 domain-containing protein, partial [Verrucomicrobiaceae bacterium]